MKGARVEPSVTIRIKPRVSRRTTMGASHHFLRTRKKLQNSRRIDNLPLIRIVFRNLPATARPCAAASNYSHRFGKQFQSDVFLTDAATNLSALRSKRKRESKGPAS